jgi:hypothetical protein
MNHILKAHEEKADSFQRRLNLPPTDSKRDAYSGTEALQHAVECTAGKLSGQSHVPGCTTAQGAGSAADQQARGRCVKSCKVLLLS